MRNAVVLHRLLNEGKSSKIPPAAYDITITGRREACQCFCLLPGLINPHMKGGRT